LRLISMIWFHFSTGKSSIGDNYAVAVVSSQTFITHTTRALRAECRRC
jgi:hypothetical protein